MRKILSLFLGLMSLVGLLVGLSSCEDKFTYVENSFYPIGYIAKGPTMKEMEEKGFDFFKETTTLQFLGVREMAFEEIEKTDWKIISKASFEFEGTAPLELKNHLLTFKGKVPTELIEVKTNYESLPVTFGNTTVTYNYMGKEMEMQPLDEVQLWIQVHETKRVESPFFFQYGEVRFILMIGDVPVKISKVEFMVQDPKLEGSDTETETGTESGTETDTETGTETDTETGTDTDTETGTESGTETETETGTETALFSNEMNPSLMIAGFCMIGYIVRRYDIG